MLGEFTILSTTSFSLQHSSCSSGGPPVRSEEDPGGTEALSKSGSSGWELEKRIKDRKDRWRAWVKGSGCQQGRARNRCIHHGELTASVSAPQCVPPLWSLHHSAFPTSKAGCASQLRCLLSSWHFLSEQSTSFLLSSAWCRLADLRRHLGYFRSGG